MGVRRYRRVEEIPPPPPSRSARDGLASACALTELTAAIGMTRVAPRGVRRFRSVEEADAHRRSWELPDVGPDTVDLSRGKR